MTAIHELFDPGTPPDAPRTHRPGMDNGRGGSPGTPAGSPALPNHARLADTRSPVRQSPARFGRRADEAGCHPRDPALLAPARPYGLLAAGHVPEVIIARPAPLEA